MRGARNYPCMGHPGKRAPTVELCNDPKGYQPLAIRQHALGPYPIDPNLIAQGIPLDDRVDFNDRIYAPLEGTPLPPGAVPAGTPPDPLAADGRRRHPRRPCRRRRREFAEWAAHSAVRHRSHRRPATPADAAGPASRAVDAPPADGAVPAAPSAFGGNGSGGPSVAITPYDPQTGQYLTPDGQLQQLTNAAAGAAPKSWKDLLPI